MTGGKSQDVNKCIGQKKEGNDEWQMTLKGERNEWNRIVLYDGPHRVNWRFQLARENWKREGGPHLD